MSMSVHSVLRKLRLFLTQICWSVTASNLITPRPSIRQPKQKNWTSWTRWAMARVHLQVARACHSRSRSLKRSWRHGHRWSTPLNSKGSRWPTSFQKSTSWRRIHTSSVGLSLEHTPCLARQWRQLLAPMPTLVKASRNSPKSISTAFIAPRGARVEKLSTSSNRAARPWCTIQRKIMLSMSKRVATSMHRSWSTCWGRRRARMRRSIRARWPKASLASCNYISSGRRLLVPWCSGKAIMPMDRRLSICAWQEIRLIGPC